MSFVRVAADSDVYAWGEGDVYMLSVRGARLKEGHDENIAGTRPRAAWADLPSPTEEWDAFAAACRAWDAEHRDEIEAWAERNFEDIEHPDAGELFSFKTIAEMWDKAVALKESGVFLIPDRFFESMQYHRDRGEV